MTQLVSAEEWKQLPSLPFGMGNFIAAASDKDILLAGGITWRNDTKEWLDQIWRYDAKPQKWAEAGKLKGPLAYAAFAQSADQVYFCGGSDGKLTSSDFSSLTARGATKEISKVQHPLVYSATAIRGGKLFVIAGGADAADLKSLTNTAYTVDLATGKTEALPEYPGGKLIVPTAAAIGDTVYVFTGAHIDANGQAVNVDAAFALNSNERGWKKIKRFPFTVRGLASCALDERHILLAGGYTNDFTDAAFIYDIKTDSYAKTKPLPYRGMVTLIKAGDDLYCVGGEDRMRHRSDLFYVTKWKPLLCESK